MSHQLSSPHSFGQGWSIRQSHFCVVPVRSLSGGSDVEMPGRAVVVLTLLLAGCAADQFNESLTVKPLVSGHVVSNFDFLITSDNIAGPHYRLVPRPLAEVLAAHQVRELHLSLTQGYWRHAVWGYPAREAPTGARLWVWFHRHTADVDASWRALVNALSGLFCASLNFMDAKLTASPELSYRPSGVVLHEADLDSRLLRVASLPREATCTENLTPWQKLLPCAGRAGLAALLNPLHLYSTSYHSLSVDFRPVCQEAACASPSFEFQFSVSVVHDLATMGQQQRRGGAGDEPPQWSLKSLYGAGVFGACALAQGSHLFVDTSINETQPFSLSPAPLSRLAAAAAGHTTPFAVYPVRELTAAGGGGGANVRAAHQRPLRRGYVPSLPLTATQYQTGAGLFSVGISVQLKNGDRRRALDVLLLQVVPWYIRVYLHTLTVTVAGAEVQPVYRRLVPGRDRGRPHLLELVVRVPAGSGATVAVQCQRAFLKWHEYPPDANHGFYLPAAAVAALLPAANVTRHPLIGAPEAAAGRVFVRVSTENLLVTLPTPDFSMPYNVICLVCTVVALAFGPLHNITTKELKLEPISGEKTGVVSRISALIGRLRSRGGGGSQSAAAAAAAADAAPQEEAVGDRPRKPVKAD